ncbi:MAG: TadE/TadG family type IV pilus assembly protein [Clostridia bacterium]|nr:TadE/TadG family type IV pilus assembly protein [Clostridia bacterium]
MLRKMRREGKGQALVEMALLLPLLLLLLFGIIEFGRVMSASFIVTHGAREGARYGAVGATDSEIVTRIQTKAAVALYDPEDPTKLSIEIGRTGPVKGGDIEVKVSYAVTLYLPLIPEFTGNPLTVVGTSVMRVE